MAFPVVCAWRDFQKVLSWFCTVGLPASQGLGCLEPRGAGRDWGKGFPSGVFSPGGGWGALQCRRSSSFHLPNKPTAKNGDLIPSCLSETHHITGQFGWATHGDRKIMKTHRPTETKRGWQMPESWRCWLLIAMRRPELDWGACPEETAPHPAWRRAGSNLYLVQC